MKQIVILFVAILASSVRSQLPPSFKICSRNSPNLANCIRDAIEHLRPNLRTGDLGNGFKIESIEPIYIDDITIDKGHGAFVSIRNVNAYGASGFKIDKIRINMENFNIDAIVSFANLEGKGDYKMNFRIAAFNLKGEGKFHLAISELKLHIKLEMQRFFKNGEEYIRIANVPNRIVKLGKIKVNLKDQQKDKVLNELINTVVNENTALFVDDFTPQISNHVFNRFMKSGNSILESVPLRFVLP